MTTASKDGVNLIAVTLDAPDDWNDHIAMYEYGFSHYHIANVSGKRIVGKITDPFYEGRLRAARDLQYPVTSEEENELRVNVYLLKPRAEWKEDPDRVPAAVGKAVLYLHDKAVDETPLLYEHKKEESGENSFWDLFSF